MTLYKRISAALLGATILAQPLWAAPPPGPPKEGADAEFGPPVVIQGLTTVRVHYRGQVLSLKVHSTSLSDEYMVSADSPELQKIARAFGAQLEWDGSTLRCRRDRDVRTMKEGQDRVACGDGANGTRQAELPLPAQAVDGTINIPLSALEEFLDVRVTVRPNNFVFIEPLIRNVHFDNTGGKTHLVIDSTAPVSYHAFKLHGPDRYVIDVAGAVLDTASLSIDNPDVGNVRLGQFELGPAISRIVVPIRGGVDVTAPRSAQGQSLAFDVRVPNPTNVSGSPPQTPLTGSEEGAPVAKGHEGQTVKISGVQWARTSQGWRLVLNADGAVRYDWQRLPGNHMMVTLPNAVLTTESKMEYPGNGDTVSSVRLSQFHPMPAPEVRIVLDLNKNPRIDMGRGDGECQMVVMVGDKPDVDAYPATRGKGWTGVVTLPHVDMPSAHKHGRPAVAVARASEDAQFIKISNVQLLKTGSGGGKLVLTADGPLRCKWERMSDNRLVVDIANAMLADPKQEPLPGNGDTISGVRLSQYQPLPNPSVRVVMDLTKPLNVALSRGETEDQLVVEVADNDPYPPSAGTNGNGTAQTPGSGLIVLDPGHGGSDVGAQNRALGVTEAQVTLDICKRLAAILKQQGWTVMMTRNSDADASYWGSSNTEELGARVKVANGNKADIFVSVHCNASVNPNSTGTSIHYYKQGDYALATELRSNVMAATGRPDRGLQANRFYVLTHTQMPAVLVETAFISNSQEGSMLSDPSFRQRIAEGLAQGVRQYAARNLNWTAAKP